MLKLYTSDLGQNEQALVRLSVLGGYAQAQRRGGLKTIRTSLIEQEGNRAVVKVELIYGNGSTMEGNVRLVRESGKWKWHLGN
jgi:hypothetical protein